MAKASAQITISRIVDISSVTRYYLLQSSTSAAPSKPTANPPGGSWTTTEPAYTSGSTNTLYFVDLTVFTNSTFSYSAVSKSSSYEAAKAAYNKAVSAQNTADNSYNKVNSRGEQLVVNGSGLMGNNTNFTNWTFDGATTNNSTGSFTRAAGSAGTYSTDEYFPINPLQEYTFSLDVKSAKGVGRLYSMIMFYDSDKNEITANTHMHNAASTTTLARELKAGDTVIYLTKASGFSTTYNYGFYMTIWNYKNSFGYTYPSGTYSRTRITLPKTSANKLNSSCLNTSANTITLSSAYTGATIPAGTSVSQGGDGGNYKYFPCSNIVIPSTWTNYSGKISGVDYSGLNTAGTFPPGVAYAKVGFLWNYQGSGNSEQLWVTNISVTDTTAASNAHAAANAAQSTANSAQSTANSAQSAANEAAKTATNYMYMDSTNGLQIGDRTSGSWSGNRAQIKSNAFNILNSSGTQLASFGTTATIGQTSSQNIYMDSDSVDIRKGTNVLAAFKSNQIDLGIGTNVSTINLCGGAGTITAESLSSNSVFDQLYIRSNFLSLSGVNYMRSMCLTDITGLSSSSVQSHGTELGSGAEYTGDYATSSLDSKGGGGSAYVGATSFADHPEASNVTINATDGSNTSLIEVTPTLITLYGKTKINIGSQYVQFDTDGSYPGIVTANYIRTPSSGIIPKTSGGSGSVGTSGWPFSSGYFKSLYVNGTAVSVSGHTHSYLPLAGGNISGHLYLTGSNASSSTGNTSQLVFGTSSSNHVVLSSNNHALVINPTTSSTTNQIVLYLDQASVFPKGISANVTGNLTGTASKATADASGNTITSTYATKTELSQARAACSARGSATSLSLSAGAITALTLNTWVVRNDTAFTFSGGGIYCPRAGNIMVSGNVYFNSTVADNLKGVYITKNNNEVFSSYIKQNNGSFSMTSGMAIIPVAAGDIIRLCARCSAANKVDPSNTATLLSVAYV